MTNRLELNWKLDGLIQEQRYYCSETPLDVNAMPTPKAVLASDMRSYSDTSIEANKTYYVRVGSVKNSVEKISSEVVVNTFENPVKRIFANGGKGLWFDFSDFSAMYQDTDGTVAITANGQSIARVNDKSGNNNHASQATTTKRPSVAVNGAFFDGIDDSLLTLLPVDYGGSTVVEIYVKIKSIYRPGRGYNCVFESGNRFNTTGKVGFISMSREENYAITGATVSTTSPNYVLFSGNQQSYDGVYTLRINPSKIEIDANGVKASNPITKNAPFTNELLWIGSRSHNVDFMNGHIKQLIIVNRELTSQERDDLLLYLAEH